MIKEIKNYEGIYGASDDGRIWSYPKKWARISHNGKWLKTWKIGHGYEMVALYKKGEKSKKFLVHRLVALTFLPNKKSLKEVNHINGKILDNRADNLEWVSSSGNKQHAWNMGLYKVFGYKITKEKAEKIREKLKKGKLGYKLAEEYGISTGMISHIRNNLAWK